MDFRQNRVLTYAMDHNYNYNKPGCPDLVGPGEVRHAHVHKPRSAQSSYMGTNTEAQSTLHPEATVAPRFRI